MKAFKIIIAWVIALFIAGICLQLILALFKLALAAVFGFTFIVILIIVAAPIYVIVKKKFLNKF